MLGWATNLGYGAGPVSPVVVEAVLDQGRDSGGGPAWWEGEWRNPPRTKLREKVAKATRPEVELTEVQKAKLGRSFEARAEAGLLAKDLARLERTIEDIGPALRETKSRREKQRLYGRRTALRKQKRRLGDEIQVLESRAEQAAQELEGLEWLAFLQAEDEQFLKIVLELI